MTPRRFTERPQARSAARQASDPMATSRLAVFSSLFFRRCDPCKPSQNVSADMPSTTKSGSQDSTASRAGNSALRMLSIIAMKLASSVTRVSGMMRREWWLVTPQGRMASNSGCTEVLVEGASTPNFARRPRESVIGIECHSLLRGGPHDQPRRVRAEAEAADRAVERADGAVGSDEPQRPGSLHEAARAISREARCSDGRAAPAAERFGRSVGGHDERHRSRLQEHAGSLRERAQEVRKEMIDHIDHIVLTTRDKDACIRFYTEILGMRLEKFSTPTGERLALKFGHQKINLHEWGREFDPKAHVPVPGSLDLCFIAAVPLEQVIGKLAGAGVKIMQGPVMKTGAAGPIRSVYVRDPDLNLIEISVPAA